MMTNFEKRRYQRLNAALQVHYKKSNGEDNADIEHKGVTVNISMGGIYFVCPDWQVQDLNIDQILKITINIPRQNYDMEWSNTLKTKGKVVRIDPYANRPNQTGIALTFLEDLRFTNA